jgi:hypothetical protein
MGWATITMPIAFAFPGSWTEDFRLVFSPSPSMKAKQYIFQRRSLSTLATAGRLGGGLW